MHHYYEARAELMSARSQRSEKDDYIIDKKLARFNRKMQRANDRAKVVKQL